MNRIPSIMVDTGFHVDQNGILTELDIPGVVQTLSPPTIVNFKGTAMNWIPSTTAALTQITADNVTTLADKFFSGYNNLVSASFGSLTNLSYGGNASGQFINCTKLTTVYMPELVSITATATATNAGAFFNCTALNSVTLSKLSTITEYGYSSNEAGAFAKCTSLVTINLPLISSITRVQTTATATGTFKNCTSLENVTLGSDGHAVTSLDSNTFLNCTQSGLTITIYTADGNALANSPFGATNATIVWEEA